MEQYAVLRDLREQEGYAHGKFEQVAIQRAALNRLILRVALSANERFSMWTICEIELADVRRMQAGPESSCRLLEKQECTACLRDKLTRV